ncbi:MAG: hypothetical protein WBA74_18560 [Cyclobacteriaceae bacterium]
MSEDQVNYMTGSRLDIRKVNAELAGLHENAQGAKEKQLKQIAGDYLTIIGKAAFRDFAFRYYWQKCKDLGVEQAEDHYQDACIRLNDHILSGKLPEIKHSASAYFLTSFRNVLLTALKKQNNLFDKSSTATEREGDTEQSEKIHRTDSMTYDLENLKNCFYLLFFIQPKLNMKNFDYYCARISFSSNELAARAIYKSGQDWNDLDAGEVKEQVYKMKNGHKTPNKNVSMLFSAFVRQQGLLYKHKYLSENAMTELNTGSLIATGIMWYYYYNREALTEGIILHKEGLQNLRVKIDPTGRLLSDRHLSKSTPFFSLEKLVLAMQTVFAGFDNRGAKYVQWLNEELNYTDVRNKDFVNWLGNSLEIVLKIDFSETYKVHEEKLDHWIDE